MSRAGSVFLIGPMGAGKSTIGRALASLLGKEFQDSDREIEARTGASIALIFEIEGEAGFRRRESAVIDELTRREDIVLATGGGAVLSEDNRRVLRGRGTVVYLHAPVDTLLKRLHRDRHRPLLQTADKRGTLSEILKTREPLYRKTADIVVETIQRSPQNVAREIAKKLERLKAHEDARS
jgi:shikimate kinase